MNVDVVYVLKKSSRMFSSGNGMNWCMRSNIVVVEKTTFSLFINIGRFFCRTSLNFCSKCPNWFSLFAKAGQEKIFLWYPTTQTIKHYINDAFPLKLIEEDHSIFPTMFSDWRCYTLLKKGLKITQF